MKKNMKKCTAVLFAACTLACLCACSGKKSGAGADRAPVKVVFWHSFSGATGEAFE